MATSLPPFCDPILETTLVGQSLQLYIALSALGHYVHMWKNIRVIDIRKYIQLMSLDKEGGMPGCFLNVSQVYSVGLPRRPMYHDGLHLL